MNTEVPDVRSRGVAREHDVKPVPNKINGFTVSVLLALQNCDLFHFSDFYS
jgi:hypothetical protein